jgi:uncharacterized protein (TIGR02145 family)
MPTLTTTALSSITYNTAISGGNITSEGGANITDRGVCWSTLANPTIADNRTNDGSGTGSFISSIAGLTANTTYYLRAYATNSIGTSYGNEINFTTITLTAPVLTSTIASSITQNAAISGGNVTSDGNAFITARGVCWSISANPTISDNHTSDGTGIGIFTSNLTVLTLNTKYYLRAYAINSEGTTYGNELSFATRGETGTMSDLDGNTYSTIVIGTQTWMAENLKTTKYKDGSSAIPLIADNTEWSNLVTPGYCWYNNDEATYKSTYGALYNWYAVSTGNLCPIGWHMPSDAEWTTLTSYLGGEDIAGGKLKETGTTHWLTPNTGATNETGFTSLPGGFRQNGGTSDAVWLAGYWWSATDNSATEAWYRAMSRSYSPVLRSNAGNPDGLSVRCLKD